MYNMIAKKLIECECPLVKPLSLLASKLLQYYIRSYYYFKCMCEL